jgi:membrane fusion protein, hemolysin D
MVSNRDIGFVNFTRYGLRHGQVLSVSQDSIIRDRQQDRSNDRALGTRNETSEPKGQELNYSARISLDRTKMQIDGRMVAVTIEIKTRSRESIEPAK